MKRPTVTVLALAFAVVSTVPAWDKAFTVIPAAYNPGKAPIDITALWSSDADAPSRHALTLAISQIVSYPPGASATAIVSPIDGLKLTHLGFDHKLGTHCTTGSPRWDVETTDGGSYAFACAAGIHDVDQPAVGWERITFSCSDVQVLKGWSGSCPLGSPQTVGVLRIVQDETGSTTLDDVDVNWNLIRQ